MQIDTEILPEHFSPTHLNSLMVATTLVVKA